ncbi:hypothetical protein [Eubacterium sp.]|uniref:hypothetical protein n=1 Tax=Eubacterium sp. TaxID=142586 RepID=UPI002FC679D1
MAIGIIHCLLLCINFQDCVQTLLISWGKVRVFFQIARNNGDVPPDVIQLLRDGLAAFPTDFPAFLADVLIGFQCLFPVVVRLGFACGLSMMASRISVFSWGGAFPFIQSIRLGWRCSVELSVKSSSDFVFYRGSSR